MSKTSTSKVRNKKKNWYHTGTTPVPVPVSLMSHYRISMKPLPVLGDDETDDGDGDKGGFLYDGGDGDGDRRRCVVVVASAVIADNDDAGDSLALGLLVGSALWLLLL